MLGDTAATTGSRTAAAIIILASDMSADELRAAIGLRPDRAWNRGDSVGKTGRGRRPFTGWRLDTKPGDVSPETLVSQLLDRARPAEDLIRAMSSDPRIHSVSLWVWSAGPTFGMELSPSSLSDIARLGASLKVDLYDADYQGHGGEDPSNGSD